MHESWSVFDMSGRCSSLCSPTWWILSLQEVIDSNILIDLRTDWLENDEQGHKVKLDATSFSSEAPFTPDRAGGRPSMHWAQQHHLEAAGRINKHSWLLIFLISGLESGVNGVSLWMMCVNVLVVFFYTRSLKRHCSWRTNDSTLEAFI